MTVDDRQKLRAAALAALAGVTARTSVQRVLNGWELQTSNSFRRIGTAHGDGDVLCGTKHPLDGHPDLLAAPGVLDYIVAAQPRAVLALLDELDRCEDTLQLSRNQHAQDHAALETKLSEAKAVCDRISAVDARLEKVAGTITALSGALSQLMSADPDAVEKARVIVNQIMSTLQEVTR